MTLLRRIYREVGWRLIREITRIRMAMGKRGTPVPFGVHLNSPGSVVIVLPEDLLKALVGVPVILAFVSRFAGADVSLLCTEAVAPYFREIEGVSRVLTYSEQRDFFFSRSRVQTAAELASLRSGLWLYLEDAPGVVLSYLSVAAKPAVRAGKIEGEETNALLNLYVRRGEGECFGDKEYGCLTSFFNAVAPKTVRWKTSKEAAAQARHVLGENGVPTEADPAGIDVVVLARQFGRDWTASLVRRVTHEFPRLGWYVYSEALLDDEWNAWLRELKLPLIVGLSASATAALLSTSEVFLSGYTYLYQLALLMGNPAIGLFRENEPSYFSSGEKERLLRLPAVPDEQALNEVLRLCPSPDR